MFNRLSQSGSGMRVLMSASSTVRISQHSKMMHLRSYAVKNHGISEEIIEATVESMKTYFSLPLNTKMEARNLFYGSLGTSS